MIISGGNITRSEVSQYDLSGFPTMPISMNDVRAATSGTPYIYMYLKVLEPGTSPYSLFIITLQIN
jgi:hypothetical protein